MHPVIPSSTKASGQFWLLSFLLIVAFMTGGSSRIDVQSLVILQPMALLICGIAVTTLKRDDLESKAWLLSGIGAMCILALAHSLPIPNGKVLALPGREYLSEIYKFAGINGISQTFALASTNSWNSFYTLFVPLAVFLLGIQLSRDDLYRLMPLLIGLGSLSGIFGLLQAIGSPDGPLYFYQITNNGSAVGLFANRNHSAVLLACMFPILAVFAWTGRHVSNDRNSRQLVAAVIAIVLVPLILVTGSRSGLLISAVGLLGAAFLYRKPLTRGRDKRTGSRFKLVSVPVLGGIAVIGLGLLTVLFSRAQAIERLFQESSGEDNRLDFWITSIDLFWTYFPIGSGAGSFATAFRIAEPSHLLDATYLNRAHNDWIEIAVTLGVPGLLLLAISVFFYLRRTISLWRNRHGERRSVAIARMAGIGIFMLTAASVSDYPLRTPTMMCVLALFVLWFVEGGREDPSRKRI